MQPDHGVGVGHDQEPVGRCQLGGSFGQQSFAKNPDGFASDPEFVELFGVNGVKPLFTQQRDVDGVDIGIQHGFRQTGVGTAGSGVVGDFVNFQL